MSEDLSQAVPAVSADGEAVPPVRAVDSDDPGVLKNKIELVKADRDNATAEKLAYKKQVQDMERQLKELQSGQQKKEQDSLVKNQEFEVLWNKANDTNKSLEEQLAEKDQRIQELQVQHQQKEIRQTAQNLFIQNGVGAPERLMECIGDQLRLDENGAIVALSGGVQVPLNTHLNNLRNPGSGYEMFFAGSGAKGMSSVGSASSAAGGKGSWSSMSFSERLAYEVENGPEAAAQLKAQG